MKIKSQTKAPKKKKSQKEIDKLLKLVAHPAIPPRGPCWSEKELLSFEKKMGFNLPENFRLYLEKIGDGGAGFSYEELPSLRKLKGPLLNRMKQKFTLKGPVEGGSRSTLNKASGSFLKGCFHLGHRSDGLDLWLVLNGLHAGEVWVDGSGIGAGLVDTEDPADFLLLQTKAFKNLIKKYAKNR